MSKNNLELAKKIRKATQIEEFEPIMNTAEGVARYCPQDVSKVIEIINRIERDYSRGVFMTYSGEVLALGGVPTLRRVEQFVRNVPCIMVYTAGSAPKIIGREVNLGNLEHCEMLAMEIGKELSSFDKLQKSGDLGSVIGAFVENYRVMLDLSGKEFIETKARSFEKWVKEHKGLCVACGRNYFEERHRRKTYIDHWDFGPWVSGKHPVTRLQEYLDANPEG